MERFDFPLHVFPKKLQMIITALTTHLGFPLEYIGPAILGATSTAIGKTLKLQVRTGWTERCCFFICLVGDPGANKSMPMKWAIQPLLDASFKNGEPSEDMFSEKSLFSTELESDTPKDRLVMNNFTIEALFKIMAERNVRLLIWVDELAGFFRNLSRYSKGSDIEYHLSIYSGLNIVVDRKTQPSYVIADPIACYMGSIQPEVLEGVFGKFEENGAFARFFYSIPKNIVRRKMNRVDLDKSVSSAYYEIFYKLFSLNFNEETGSESILFTEEAEVEAFRWFDDNVDALNAEADTKVRNLISKLDIGFFRLCLWVQIVRWGCDEAAKDAVDLDSVKSAIELIEYFRECGLEALRLISADPIERMNDVHRKVYENIKVDVMTELFTTSHAIRVAAIFGMSERALKYFLNRTDLFKRVKLGHYKKLL